MAPFPRTLIVAQSGADPTMGIVIWVGALIAALLVGSLAVFWLRRRLRHDGGGETGQDAFLKQLRQMRDLGELSPEEYANAKRAALGLPGEPTPRRASMGQPTQPRAPHSPSGADNRTESGVGSGTHEAERPRAEAPRARILGEDGPGARRVESPSGDPRVSDAAADSPPVEPPVRAYKARPGYDLTGRPLPPSQPSGDRPAEPGGR